LSAYDFTEDPLFLEKAEEVVKKLLPAFKTPSGIPKASVNLQRSFSSIMNSYITSNTNTNTNTNTQYLCLIEYVSLDSSFVTMNVCV
jgi:hypothetical protein